MPKDAIFSRIALDDQAHGRVASVARRIPTRLVAYKKRRRPRANRAAGEHECMRGDEAGVPSDSLIARSFASVAVDPAPPPRAWRYSPSPLAEKALEHGGAQDPGLASGFPRFGKLPVAVSRTTAGRDGGARGRRSNEKGPSSVLEEWPADLARS